MIHLLFIYFDWWETLFWYGSTEVLMLFMHVKCFQASLEQFSIVHGLSNLQRYREFQTAGPDSLNPVNRSSCVRSWDHEVPSTRRSKASTAGVWGNGNAEFLEVSRGGADQAVPNEEADLELGPETNGERWWRHCPDYKFSLGKSSSLMQCPLPRLYKFSMGIFPFLSFT